MTNNSSCAIKPNQSKPNPNQLIYLLWNYNKDKDHSTAFR